MDQALIDTMNSSIPVPGLVSEAPLIQHKNLKFLAINVKHSHTTYVSLFFLQISWRLSISMRYLSTLCGVQVAGDSNWSSKRRYLRYGDRLAITTANRKQARVSSQNIKSVPYGEKIYKPLPAFLIHNVISIRA